MSAQKNAKASFDIRSNNVAHCIGELDNLIRAEYNKTHNFLEYYAGKDNLEKVKNVKNQVIYGRRGTGKTHLLRALQESLIADNKSKYFPVYIDVRSYKPLLHDDNPLYYSLILFKEFSIELLKAAYENVAFLFGLNELDPSSTQLLNTKKELIRSYLGKFNATFEGKDLKRIGDLEFTVHEITSIAASLNISLSPELIGNSGSTKETQTATQQIKYISFAEMAEVIAQFLNNINVDRLFILIDEWSEIPIQIQPLLAELLKRAFITLKITMKIAAIPNRTRLMVDNRMGLEDGGDIFGYQLDYRFIYELHPDITKKFFNELLYNQLGLIDNNLFKPFFDRSLSQPNQSFINMFLANQALREILIASAGIPRDFLSIFINSYAHYINRNTNHKHMALTDIRAATVAWYEVDKKKAIEANKNAKIMLDKIIKEIILDKKRCHFMIPEKYETNEILNDLIDLRILHLRKHGISHKGNKGVSYNVYYVDYACYTSSNIYHNRINSNLLNDIEAVDDFREIRRISLEDKFFESLNTELGNCFRCPHCNRMVDTTHAAYIKQRICNHCYDKVEVKNCND